MIWATYNRERMLFQEPARKVSAYLYEYARSKEIYMKINFVNPDHVHALIDLPRNLSIEEVAKLLKGSSSHWINQNRLLQGKFYWGRGYGAFSVSHSLVPEVSSYMASQEEHHKRRTFREELEQFVTRYGLEWREETVKTVNKGGDEDSNPLDESRG
jgi:REP element-mobilizing transposase RayT